MTAPIHCCYRGCALTVWAPTDAGLTVQRSSATCTACRRVALCLPHFEAVAESQRDLRCPNCREQRWYVRLMSGDRLPAALEVAVRATGGRIEADEAPSRSTGSGGEPGDARRDALASIWRWVPANRVPADARILARGVLARVHAKGAVVLVDGRPLDWLCPEMPSAAARSTAADDIVLAHGPSAMSCLSWVGPEGLHLTIAGLPDGGVDRPVFVDARRFVYVSRAPSSDESLWEANIEQSTRVRQRRVTHLGRGPHRAPAPVVVQHREAVVALASDGEVCAPVWIRLSDGRRTPLAAHGPPPRALVGAARGRRAAWIDADGTVRCAGEHHPMQSLGRTDGHLLAITEDGRAVAWTTGDAPGAIETCDLRTGAVHRDPLQAPLAWLGPRST